MIEICLLGTASGLPATDRFGQTIVLTITTPGSRAERVHYILDCGDGASSLLTRHGFDHRDVRGIFVSHMHADHHGGFAQVVKTCMHVQKEDELIALAPEEGIAPLRAYLDASYLFAAWLGFPVEWIPLADRVGKAVSLPGEISLRVYPNAHLAWFRQRAAEMDDPLPRACTFESYSAVFEHGGRRVVYSGNLHGSKGSDEMAPFAEPCDILIAELAHVDPVELGRFLAGRAIRRTVVTHFHPRWNGVADADILALVRQGAGERGIAGAVSLARDGDRFVC